MAEHTPDFAPPNPDTRVSELDPDRLQKWAVEAGKKILDTVGQDTLLTTEQVQHSYGDLKRALARGAVDMGVFEPDVQTPLSFVVIIPVEIDDRGQQEPRSTWRFLSAQYLGSLSKGVYPIALTGEGPTYHDALHAAEISILQKYCPEVSQLIIDSAIHALDESPEIQKSTTEIIDYFTDTFSLDSFSVGIFEWRASDLYRTIDPSLSKEQAVKKAKALALKAVSGLTRYMNERAAITEE